MSGLNWREVLIALIVLLVLYVLVTVVRMRWFKRKGVKLVTPVGDSHSLAAKAALAAYGATQVSASPLPPAESAATAASSFPWNEPPEQVPGQPRIAALEHEIGQLRKEVGGLRAELVLVKDEFRREQSQSQMTQNVSPLYADAMQMAVQGHDAMAISEHFGISRGEAELVVALARNQDL